MRRLTSIFFAASILIGMSACMQEDYMHRSDGYSELISAIDYRANQCGNRPQLPLILPEKPSKYSVHLCAVSIIRMSCPFNDYPPFCLEIFIDLPGIGP